MVRLLHSTVEYPDASKVVTATEHAMQHVTDGDNRAAMGVARKRLDPLSKQTSSPLLVMQKNYQQKIYAEKEKKMLDILQRNQDASLRKVSDNSSKDVKNFFDRKLDKHKASGIPLHKDKSKAVSQLPPLLQKPRQQAPGDEIETSKEDSRASSLRKLNRRNRSITKSKSFTVQSANGHGENDDGPTNGFDRRNSDEDSGPLDTNCLRLIRDRRNAERKRELLKLNRQFVAARSDLDDDLGRCSPREEKLDYYRNEYAPTIRDPVQVSRLQQLKQNQSKYADSKAANSVKPKKGRANKEEPTVVKTRPSRHRVASTLDEPAANGHKHHLNGINKGAKADEIRFDETYSKHKGLSEQIKALQTTGKIDKDHFADSSSAQDTFSSFGKPVMVRHDSRSSGSRTSSRTVGNTPTTAKNKNGDYEFLNSTSAGVVNSQGVEVAEYEQVTLKPCSICGRKFAADRLAKHRTVCAKNSRKQRKAFDMAAARRRGTELEGFKSSNARSNRQAVNKRQRGGGDWRAKHEDFIATIRHAKSISTYVARGGNPADLPPPPASHNPDYVECQYCLRKFAPGVADRHIPKCKEIKARPPPPKRKAK